MWSAEKPGAPVKVVPSSGEELLFPAVSAQGRGENLIASTLADTNPEYSPDGRKILFGSNRTAAWELWKADEDGSHPVQITLFGGAMVGSARWSPDGEQIAFDVAAGGRTGVDVISATGSAPKRLSEGAGEGLPSWSRDGRWIYFTSRRSGSQQIWKMPAGGGTARQVTTGGGLYGVESHDAQDFYYQKKSGGSLWQMPVTAGLERELLGPVFWRNFAVVRRGIYFMHPEAQGLSIRFYSFAKKRLSRLRSSRKPLMLA